MVDAGNGPDEAALAIAARHALHDEELVAALATGSLDDAVEAGRAQALIVRCTACRDLHADIAAIDAALRLDAQGTVAAPRDFRLTVEDARRLGGPVSVGGFLANLRRSMQSFARPVGASMATLGIVGLLVGSISLGGSAASAPLSGDTGLADASTAPVGIQTGEGPAAPKSTDGSVAFGPVPSAGGQHVDTTPRESNPEAPGPSPVAFLMGGSLVLLLAGIGLLLVAFRRGRRGDTRS